MPSLASYLGGGGKKKKGGFSFGGKEIHSGMRDQRADYKRFGEDRRPGMFISSKEGLKRLVRERKKLEFQRRSKGLGRLGC